MRFYFLTLPIPDTPEERLGYTDVTKPEFDVNRGLTPTCSRCDRDLGQMKWLPPFKLELETWGKHYGDVAGIGEDLIVSKRFKNLFADNALRGLTEFEPVEIVSVSHFNGSKPKDPIPRYFKSSVPRSNTAVDQMASCYEWENPSAVCPECLMGGSLKRHKSLIIDLETWTGEDVFYPRGGNGPIASEQFRSLFVAHGFFGASFIPVEEAGYDYYPWESLDAKT